MSNGSKPDKVCLGTAPMDEGWKSAALGALCFDDGEFRIAARGWTGGLRLEIDERRAGLIVTDGVPGAGDPGEDAPGVITLAGPEDVWAELLAAHPPRFYNDLFSVLNAGKLDLRADPVLYAQYYPAAMRALELLRPSVPAPASAPRAAQPGSFDSPVGRYLHLEL